MMAGVFRESVIAWGGKEYTFTPSMRLLRNIESDGTSIMHVAHMVHTGKPQASIMARIVAMVMQSAGANVSEDDIYQAIMVGEQEQALSLYGAVMEAISPSAPSEKKPEGRVGE
jgi:hypothetical protein